MTESMVADTLVLQRRHLLAAGAALACVRPARADIPSAGTLAFQVSRNGSIIGTHTLTFAKNGSNLTVRIDAAFRVHFGPVTFYRYRHQGVEQWQDGRFATLDTRTDDNGTAYEVHARRSDAGVLIQATNLPDQVAPHDTYPLTHWAEAAMGARLFNPQTGKLLHETAQPNGSGLVALANGARIEATRFALAGEAPIEDWYDSSKRWAALDATGSDGSQITYRRL
jgi:hypothetical protein